MNIANIDSAIALFNRRKDLITILQSLRNDSIVIDIEGNGTLLMRLSTNPKSDNYLTTSHITGIKHGLIAGIEEQIEMVENKIKKL